jgi:hypothetical protein
MATVGVAAWLAVPSANAIRSTHRDAAFIVVGQ